MAWMALNYFQGPPPSEKGWRIAPYAWNQDCHELIEGKVKASDASLTTVGNRWLTLV